MTAEISIKVYVSCCIKKICQLDTEREISAGIKENFTIKKHFFLLQVYSFSIEIFPTQLNKIETFSVVALSTFVLANHTIYVWRVICNVRVESQHQIELMKARKKKLRVWFCYIEIKKNQENFLALGRVMQNNICRELKELFFTITRAVLFPKSIKII